MFRLGHSFGFSLFREGLVCWALVLGLSVWGEVLGRS